MVWIGDCSWYQSSAYLNSMNALGSVCVPTGLSSYYWVRCAPGYGYGYGYDYNYNYNYGYPYGSPYGYRSSADVWYLGQQPFVIVQGGGTATGANPATHGKVVNGRGYTQGGAVESGGTASPASSTPSAPASAPSSSGSSDGGGASSAPSSSGGSGERTAHPR